jgi:hypothetical protein
MIGMIDAAAIRLRWEAVGSKQDERGRRLFAAVEVRAAGWGGLALVSKITGWRGRGSTAARTIWTGSPCRRGASGARAAAGGHSATGIRRCGNSCVVGSSQATLGDPMPRRRPVSPRVELLPQTQKPTGLVVAVIMEGVLWGVERRPFLDGLCGTKVTPTSAARSGIRP